MDNEQQEEATEDHREVTILLLGETGVGKSTWINGFANFLQFTTLDVAEQQPTLCVIPTSFTVTDENYEERLITVGNDGNEVMETGQSATQQPQSYLFPKDGYRVRLIDTPGIGDVRGVEQDKKNFERILDHISHLDSLHAICILLKPNNARLNIMFQFCIKELLTHLHKDACQNIVFCFTNSRSTFYRPGDTLPALRKLIEENKHVEIPLNHSTLYCMDNEAIRFLYAKKNGINFTADERNNYIASWEKSVEEIARLLDRASASPPHSIQSTLSLNTARQTILALGSPMAEVTRNIQLNIAIQEGLVEKMTNSEKSKEELSHHLVTQEYEIRMKQLTEPRTVCTAARCVDFVDIAGVQEVNYKSHCHESCGTGKEKHFKIVNIVGHKRLRKCSAFDSNGICKKCNCAWKEHMKITYETSLIVKEIPDWEKKTEMQHQENVIKKIEKYIDKLGNYVMELKQEQEEITKASVEFSKFLRLNAITPYNNAMEAYIAHFIHDEKNKLANGGNRKVLEGLLQMQAEYKRQMEVLENAMKEPDCGPPMTPAQLDECVKKLYKMKHNGPKLRDMMEKSQDAASSCFTEKLVERNASFTIVKKKKRNLLKGMFGHQKSTKRNKDYKGQPEGSSTTNQKMHGKLPSVPPIPRNKPQLDTFGNAIAGNVSKMKDVFAGRHQQENVKPKPGPAVGKIQHPAFNQQRPPPNLAIPVAIKYSDLQTMDINDNIDADVAPQAHVDKGLPPPPPLPPPPMPESNIQLQVPVLTSARASLLEDIRKQPKLKKTEVKAGTGNEKGGSLEAVMKRALEMRAAKVQDSVDDDEWD